MYIDHAILDAIRQDAADIKAGKKVERAVVKHAYGKEMEDCY